MTATDQPALLAKLHADTRIPSPELVQQINKGTFTAAAVGHADITDILLAHDPCWTWEPFARDETGLPRITVDKSGRLAMWATLTVHGHTRLEVGTCMATSPDPLKELVGDFLRRGAMRFGVSLKLWSKSEWSEAGDEDRSGERTPGGTSGKESAKDNVPRAGTTRKPKSEPVLPKDQALAAQAAQLGFDEKTRGDVIFAITKGRTRSGKDLETAEVIWVATAYEEIAGGIVELRYDEDGTPRVGKPRVPAGNNPGPYGDDPF